MADPAHHAAAVRALAPGICAEPAFTGAGINHAAFLLDQIAAGAVWRPPAWEALGTACGMLVQAGRLTNAEIVAARKGLGHG